MPRDGRQTGTVAGQPLVTDAALALALTLSRHDDATTRRLRKITKSTKSHEENLKSHFDGFCPLAAPRFARWQE